MIIVGDNGDIQPRSQRSFAFLLFCDGAKKVVTEKQKSEGSAGIEVGRHIYYLMEILICFKAELGADLKQIPLYLPANNVIHGKS